MSSTFMVRRVPNTSSSMISASSNASKASSGFQPTSASWGNRGRISASTRTGTGTAAGFVSHVLAFSWYSGGVHTPSRKPLRCVSSTATLRLSPLLLGNPPSVMPTTATASHSSPFDWCTVINTTSTGTSGATAFSSEASRSESTHEMNARRLGTPCDAISCIYVSTSFITASIGDLASATWEASSVASA